MTENEVEVVAEELAKVGGTTWHPGRERGPLLRAVSQRYRDRARVAIAALDRLRAKSESPVAPQELTVEIPAEASGETSGENVQVGVVVVYRPPLDQRAITCRVEKVEDGRAYLVPCALPDVGWVSIDTLQAVDLKAPASQ
jgi:hypothetical protein